MILPEGEHRRALAATFVSSKWPGRCPEDMALIRVFAGGHRDPDALARTDAELAAMAEDELRAIVGVRARPVLTRVFRFARGNAQPTVGHPARLARIRAAAARHPGLHLAGAAFDGVGLPDCVRQANEAARRIAEDAVVARRTGRGGSGRERGRGEGRQGRRAPPRLRLDRGQARRPACGPRDLPI